MFTSLAQSAVEASALRARWDADEERQTEFANRLDLYADDYEAIIRNMIDKLFHKSNADRLHYHVNQTQNVPKRIVNEGSTVYKVPATRTFGKGVDIPRWTSIAEAIDFGTRMKRLNRLVNLLNEVIVKPTVRRGALTLDFITPNRCSVIQNEEDPTVADAYLFSRSWVNTVSASELAEYEFWGVDGNVYLLDEHFRLKQTIYTPEDYPYRDPRTREPVLPMVAFHRQPPEDTFWDQDSGRDLYNAGVLAGVKMTLFDYYFKTASFKQIYVIGGGDVPSGQVLDPMTIFTASSDPGTQAEIGTLDLQLNFEGLIAALTYQINTIAATYGISPEQWSLSVPETSGRALKIRNRALLEWREEQIPTYRKGERELFERIRLVNNAYAKAMRWEKIPEETEITVNFGEIDFPEAPEDELRLDLMKVKAGVLSPGQFALKYDPDLGDEKKAEKEWLRRLDLLAQLREAHPALDEALAMVLKGGGGGSGSGGSFGNEGDDEGDDEDKDKARDKREGFRR